MDRDSGGGIGRRKASHDLGSTKAASPQSRGSRLGVAPDFCSD